MSLATTPMCHHPQCGAELGRVGAERGGFGVQGSQAGAGDGTKPPLGVASSKPHASQRCTQGWCKSASQKGAAAPCPSLP